MADNILRLKVESTEYDNKLKAAAEGLTRYIAGCRKVGGTLEVVEKETLQYAQSLGQMETKSRSSTSGFNEMKRAFVDLSMQYRGLTDTEKNSKFGQALSSSLGTLKGRINDTREAMEHINNQIDNANEGRWYVKFGSISSGLMSMKESTSKLGELARSLAEAYAVQEEAELKLTTIMRQRMNASDEEVNSIKRLASEQQKIGVIGDEVQLAGAQQVATFLKNKESIEALLPAMNNLAVQQNGLNVNSEAMVNIGNMVGKVMQGQTGALRRVGISFTEAQEKALKYGSELDRAKTLAQVITDNVGDMNAKLAKTDAGKAKQMANSFGDWQEEIGKAIAKYEALLQAGSQVGLILTSVIQISVAFHTLGKAILSTNILQKAFTVTQASFAAMGALVTAAINGQTLSLQALRAGIKGTIVSLGVIGVAYLAVSTAVEALMDSTGMLGDKADETRKKTDQLSDAQSRQAAQAERAASLQKNAAKVAGEAVGSVVGKFKTFQREWSLLKTTGDQTKWIKKNQSAFTDMGLAIGSVNEANRVFVKDSKKVIEALKAIAEADAYKEEYGKSMVSKAKAERNKTVASGSYYRTAKGGQRIGEEELPELVSAGVMTQREYEQRKLHKFVKPSYDHTDSRYVLSAKDAVALNAYRRRQSIARRNAYMDPYRQDASYWEQKMTSAEERASKAASYLGALGHPYSEPSANKTATTTRAGETVKEKSESQEDAISKELRDNNDKITSLSHEFVNASDERRGAIRGEIADLQERNKTIENAISLAKGEKKVAEAPETASGLSGLNAPTIAAWRQWREDDLGHLDMGTREGMTAAIRIEADMENMDTLQQTVSEALAKGVALPADALGSLYETIFNADNIPDEQLQSWVDAINEKLKEAGLGEIEVKTEDDGSGQKQIRKLEKGAENTKKGWQDAARAMQSVGSALQGIEDPAMKVAGIVAEAVANIALSFAQATAKDAKLGVWGWISAIAAGTATMISTISSIKSATRHAAGGIIGGNSPSGDNILMATTGVPALVNSGELVLNRAQQGNLASQLTSNISPTAGSPYVTGEVIYLGLRNYLRGHGYGDIVTTNR